MAKIDFKKKYKALYNQKGNTITIVDVPELQYLTVDGKGDPNTSLDFSDSMQTLYSLAYTIKFAVKKKKPSRDYSVMPSEGLWWMEDMASFTVERKNEWLWTLMILQPDFITQNDLDRAVDVLEKKKPNRLLRNVKLVAFNEGKSAQLLYIGSFADEGATIQKLHTHIQEHGYITNGKHHEIYFSDPRKTAPSKLKTIIRQPIRPVTP
jgi:hypothetical protein